MANLYYVNLHSSTFTAGEIRGQLVRELQQVLILGEVTNKTFLLRTMLLIWVGFFESEVQCQW
jgi:hypothetical protein